MWHKDIELRYKEKGGEIVPTWIMSRLPFSDRCISCSKKRRRSKKGKRRIEMRWAMEKRVGEGDLHLHLLLHPYSLEKKKRTNEEAAVNKCNLLMHALGFPDWMHLVPKANNSFACGMNADARYCETALWSKERHSHNRVWNVDDDDVVVVVVDLLILYIPCSICPNPCPSIESDKHHSPKLTNANTATSTSRSIKSDRAR